MDDQRLRLPDGRLLEVQAYGDPVTLCGPTDRASWWAYAVAVIMAECSRGVDLDVLRRAASIADAMFSEELNRCTEEEMNRSSAKGG